MNLRRLLASGCRFLEGSFSKLATRLDETTTRVIVEEEEDDIPMPPVVVAENETARSLREYAAEPSPFPRDEAPTVPDRPLKGSLRERFKGRL